MSFWIPSFIHRLFTALFTNVFLFSFSSQSFNILWFAAFLFWGIFELDETKIDISLVFYPTLRLEIIHPLLEQCLLYSLENQVLRTVMLSNVFLTFAVQEVGAKLCLNVTKLSYHFFKVIFILNFKFIIDFNFKLKS